MASTNASTGPRPKSTVVTVEVPLNLRNYFQPANKPATLQASKDKEVMVSKGFKTLNRDNELPDVDAELRRCYSQRALATPTKPTVALSGPTSFPTPVATPSEPPHQALNFSTPPRTPDDVFCSVLGAHRKRPYTPDSEDHDPTFTPSKRSRNHNQAKTSSLRSKNQAPSAKPPLRVVPALITTSEYVSNATPAKSAKPAKPAKKTDIAVFEAKRVRRSVMEQVDWGKVGEDVACNRRAGVYKEAVVGVLDKWLDEVTAREQAKN